MSGEDQSWLQYQRFVLAELGRISSSCEDLSNKLTAMHVTVATMETRNNVMASICGFVAALVPTCIAIVFELYKK